jgi:hypothetical protein
MEPALCRVSGFVSADEALRHRSVVVPTASKSYDRFLCEH